MARTGRFPGEAHCEISLRAQRGTYDPSLEADVRCGVFHEELCKLDVKPWAGIGSAYYSDGIRMLNGRFDGECPGLKNGYIDPEEEYCEDITSQWSGRDAGNDVGDFRPHKKLTKKQKRELRRKWHVAEDNADWTTLRRWGFNVDWMQENFGDGDVRLIGALKAIRAFRNSGINGLVELYAENSKILTKKRSFFCFKQNEFIRIFSSKLQRRKIIRNGRAERYTRLLAEKSRKLLSRYQDLADAVYGH